MALKDRIHDLENQPKESNDLDVEFIRRCEDCAEDLRQYAVRYVESAIKDGRYKVKGVFRKKKFVSLSTLLVVEYRVGQLPPAGESSRYYFNTSLERTEFENRAVKKLQQEGFICTIERLNSEQSISLRGNDHRLVYTMEWE